MQDGTARVERAVGLVTSDDGTEIFYDERTPAGADGPTILLVHGWAQCSRAWEPLIPELTAAGRRVVAVDLRGHGYSSVPDGPDAFTSDRWAADLAAVRASIEGPVVLVGWSYGGLAIADHLAERGTEGVAGVVLIGAITSIGGDESGAFPGGVVGETMAAALPDALSARPGKAIAGLSRLRIMPPAPEFGALAQQQFGYALATPATVRGGLFRRTVDHDADLASWTFPVLVQHGTADAVVAPSVARHHAAMLPDAELDLWEGTGHAPFAEDPRRCADALLEHASRAHSRGGV
ncbi:alpha/beta hydrolase [Tsukamurella sp. 8F]|uniref:alpha/beta fold hydrolase n=1 Tax=unclassified Tsukamurella TaxID=2633480 RepID=UPI0023BA1FFD|nr:MULTISPECIES: alpha/beta hydrolase [unclassified Tsukamurella]MDF0532357.1 alpha/beta hydrolase [Tsukamurella sp. 8J]MDF0589365.1 alpha/beta hydrolase [Tsukamurella sp. 8F]